MLDQQGPPAKRRPDPGLLTNIPIRPCRIRISEPDRSIKPHRRDQKLRRFRLRHDDQYLTLDRDPVGRGVGLRRAICR